MTRNYGMHFWLLKLNGPADYDSACAFVVRAESARRARVLVAESSEVGLTPGDEGRAPWLDPERSTCVMLAAEGVILRDFTALTALTPAKTCGAVFNSYGVPHACIKPNGHTGRHTTRP